MIKLIRSNHVFKCFKAGRQVARHSTVAIPNIQSTTSHSHHYQTQPNHTLLHMGAIGLAAVGITLSTLSDPLSESETASFDLSKEDITNVARLINGFIDLPDLDEDEEQEIFEFVVTKIVLELQTMMPQIYSNMMLDKERGLGNASLNMLLTRLESTLVRKLDFPFLDEDDEQKVIYATTVLFVESLAQNKCLNEILLEGPKCHEFMSIFIRGNLGFMNAKQMKMIKEKAFTSGEFALPIPLLPKMKASLLSSLLALVTEVSEEAISRTLAQTFGPSSFVRLVSGGPKNIETTAHHFMDKILVRKCHNDEPSLLRSNFQTKDEDLSKRPFCELLKQNLSDIINEKVDIPLLNEAQEQVIFTRIVEFCFKWTVPEAKINQKMEQLKNFDREAQKKIDGIVSIASKFQELVSYVT